MRFSSGHFVYSLVMMREMTKTRFLLLFLLLLPFSASAQTGVYASFSASNFDLPNIGWQYGPTFGLYHDFAHAPLLSAGADARASLLGSGSTKAYTGLIGPRVQLHPHLLPVKPYAEVLIGAGQVEYGQGTAHTDSTKFAYQLIGGADVTILPRIDWRVAEFSFGGFSALGDSFHPKTLSTGVVLRLP